MGVDFIPVWDTTLGIDFGKVGLIKYPETLLKKKKENSMNLNSDILVQL